MFVNILGILQSASKKGDGLDEFYEINVARLGMKKHLSVK